MSKGKYDGRPEHEAAGWHPDHGHGQQWRSKPHGSHEVIGKKYVLCPGYVIARNGADRRFISAPQLARLYDVKLTDCVLWRSGIIYTDAQELLFPTPELADRLEESA